MTTTDPRPNPEIVAQLRARTAEIEKRVARERARQPVREFNDGRLVGEIDLGRSSLRVSLDARHPLGPTVVFRLYAGDQLGRIVPRYALALPAWACGQVARVFADALDLAASTFESNAARPELHNSQHQHSDNEEKNR